MLPPAAQAAVADGRARPFSYGVRVLASPEGRALVVVGEAHLKLPAASDVGRRLVDAFELRGTEGFPGQRVIGGRLLRILIHTPRLVLRALSLGVVRRSTIADALAAQTGRTYRLEEGLPIPPSLHVAALYLSMFLIVLSAAIGLEWAAPWVPPAAGRVVLWLSGAFCLHLVGLLPAVVWRDRWWSWLLHPAIALLTERDRMMADGTLEMLAENPTDRAALVIMGRAHLPGYERSLVQRHGFRRIS